MVGLAGCLSGDDDDTINIVIGGTPNGSSTMAAGQAYARAANKHSDIIDITVQETDGWVANLYEYNDEQIPAMGVDNNSLSKAIANEGPFADNPVDRLPQQGFRFTALEMHWVALEGTGIESTEDLREGGYTIYPIQPGFGSRLLTEEIIRDAGLWDQNEILNVDVSDIPGAVEEDRVDALCLYGPNGIELSGWCQEVDVRSDGRLHLLEVGDEFRQIIEDHPGAILQEYEAYGYEQDVTKVTDTIVSWGLPGQWAFDPEIPAEATNEMARLALEHEDTIRESDPATLDYSPDVMTQTVLEDLEVHEGIADFFDEHDVWDDSWERGGAE